eukprot:CFRG7617T1
MGSSLSHSNNEVINESLEKKRGNSTTDGIVVVLRHGERADESDPSGLWMPATRGRNFDPELTQKGILQAQRVAHTIHAKDTTQGIVNGLQFHGPIYCSPLLRTCETAACIALVLNRPVYLVRGLGECCAAATHAHKHNFSLPYLSLNSHRKRSPTIEWALSPDYDKLIDESFEEACARLALANKGWPVLVVAHREGIYALMKLANVPLRRACYCAAVSFRCWQEGNQISWELLDFVYEGEGR